MSVWGIVPAAGLGSRIQPLAFSKELLPVGSRIDPRVDPRAGGAERPKAVSEYLVERMILAGARKICVAISPGKSDIIEYYGGNVGPADIFYVVQPQPRGLCDALFRAAPLIAPDDQVLIGLPDTVWFPEDGLSQLPAETLSFLLFPVARPELFDAVLTDPEGRVREVQVKRRDPGTHWIWGAFRMPGRILHELHALWRERDQSDAYVGTLVNAWLERGGEARGVRAGQSYVDVGTLNGYREAIQLLGSRPPAVSPPWEETAAERSLEDVRT
ncbi:MAG TPA: sugar phosphate nucleotidyltransferase [Thermoanaerobaculia bacterium]|nr:sugar phosphate nucleotidyltransferase [Thermoanaerobaculia bacterium]